MSPRTEALEARAAALVQRLRNLDLRAEAELIDRWIPEDVNDDEHLPRLRSALQTVARNEQLPEDERALAAQLADVNLAEVIGQIGTVYLSWWQSVRPEDAEIHPPHYVGYWDGSPEYASFLEEAPASTDVARVLRWAAERSVRILVRPRWMPDVTYWAGDDRLRPADIPPLRDHGHA